MTTLPLQRASPRHSPCIGICRIDERTQLCLGCARSRAEIAAWSSLDEAGQKAIWNRLSARIPELSIRFRLLPWNPDEIASFVRETLLDRDGTWTVGMPGGLAEFPCGRARDITMTSSESAIVGRAKDVRFRLRLHDRMRAFEFTDGGPIVLGLPKGRVTLPTASSLTEVGVDSDAIDPAFNGRQLFDLGLGRRWSRFCVRPDADLACELRASLGCSFDEVLARHGAELIASSPHRVLESELLRIEVFTRFAGPSETSPDGAHTRLSPELLASGDEVPPAFALPDYAATVATFHPKPSCDDSAGH